MLRLVFTANDFASTQFLPQPAPALEMKFAALALRQGISTPWGERWRCHALAASPTSSVPVRTLTSHFTWSISPTMIAADLDESLEVFPRLGARQLRAELEQFSSCPNVGLPPFIRYALDGDREAMLSLCRRTRNLFTTVLEPYWPDIRANHRSELVRRGRLDDKLRRNLKYSFARVDAKTLFLEQIIQWDYPQDAVGDLNTATRVTTLTFDQDGIAHEAIDDSVTGTEEVISRSDVPLDINWEQVPEFGDWSGVARRNRESC